MGNETSFIGPEDEGEILEKDSEIIVPVTEYTEGIRTTFEVDESEAHEQLLKVEEQIDDEGATKARAYFRKGRKLTYEMIPDHIKGDEGKKFLRIAGALAAAGAGAYIVIRKKNRG